MTDTPLSLSGEDLLFLLLLIETSDSSNPFLNLCFTVVFPVEFLGRLMKRLNSEV